VSWDLLGYTGAALKQAGVPAEQLHRLSYSLVEASIDAETFAALITDDNAQRPSTYRSTTYSEPQAFLEQLPYYQIRPLFNGALALGYKWFGWSPVTVLIGISLIAAVIMALLCYRRLCQSMPALPAFSAMAALLLVFSYQSMASITTVDGLFACSFVGFVLAFERGLNFWQVLSLSLLLVLVRSNAIVFVMPMLIIGVVSSYLHWSKTQLIWWQGLIVFASMFVGMKIVEEFYGNYGWWTVYYFTFVESINYPSQFNGHFNLSDYIPPLIKEGRWLLSDRYTTFFGVVLAISVLQLCSRRLDGRQAFGLAVVGASAMTVIMHFLLFPAALLRFFLPVFLLSSLYCVISLWHRLESSDEDRQLQTSGHQPRCEQTSRL